MEIAVERHELGQIGTNCYVVRARPGAPDAVVVDPGGDAEELLRRLGGARCEGILITHCHWDHIGAVAEVAEATGAPVYMGELEAVVLEEPEMFFPGLGVRPHVPDVRLDGDETIELAGLAFETLSVPGHSPGHLAFRTDGALFSGDVLFAGGVGRTDLPMADWDTLVESIAKLMESLPPETVVYPGHGPETTLGAELRRNPFLAQLRA